MTTKHVVIAVGPLCASALALELAAMTAAGAQAQPNVDELLVRVGERVAEFYRRATERHLHRNVHSAGRRLQ